MTTRCDNVAPPTGETPPFGEQIKSWAQLFRLINSGPLIIIGPNCPHLRPVFFSRRSSRPGQRLPTDAGNETENCLLRRHREIVCIFSPRVLNLCAFPIPADICSRPDTNKSQLFTVGHDKNTELGFPGSSGRFIVNVCFVCASSTFLSLHIGLAGKSFLASLWNKTQFFAI